MIKPSEIEKRLPPGTIVDMQHMSYRYRAFKMDWLFLRLHPGFNWKNYVDVTMYECLRGTRERFMRKV